MKKIGTDKFDYLTLFLWVVSLSIGTVKPETHGHFYAILFICLNIQRKLSNE